MEPAPILAIACLLLAAASLTVVIAHFRLRHRHRAMRHTLTRVARERDALRWGGSTQA